MNKIKKSLVTIIIIALLLMQTGSAYAFSIPQAPEVPSAPTALETPTAQEDPSAPSAPEAPSAPTTDEVLDPSPTPTQAPDENQTDNNSNETNSETQAETNQSSDPQGGTVSNGNTGDTTIETGDSTNTGVINSLGNNNESLSPGAGADCLACAPDNGSVGIINDNNGANSDNSGSATIIENNTTVQDNSAVVFNNLNQNSISGQNSASQNTGGDSSIETGDANTTGTIITGVNTNVAGVGVSEFNIADDHIGDIVLDFGANCISGCGSAGNTTIANAGNGANSQNNAAYADITNNYTFQNNDAGVISDLTLSSDSGNNTASQNTGGDSTITTGDANVSANALTFVNNNLAGNVIFGVVNIFGDLVGDIILPESEINKAFASFNTTLANVNNGAESTNSTSLDQSTSNASFQTNDATVENNLILAANTGANSVSSNTNGDSSVETGNATVNAQVLNIVNSNVSEGYWWLVIVNEAGNWVGKLLGAPDGANFAGSEGTEFVVSPDGTISAINADNGAGSNNNSSASQTSNNILSQTNTANIINNLNLSANTGNNTASKNTGGDSTVKTGDAKVIANLVNFVNNNISGKGKLVVTMVNVFGSWLGDFVSPGQQKEDEIQLASAANDTNESANQESNNSPRSAGGINLPNDPNNSDENNTEDESSATTAQTSRYTSVPADSSSNTNILTAAMHFAGISTQVSSEKNDALGINAYTNPAKNKSTSINLAWFILIVPLVVLYILIRKRIYLKNFRSE